MRKKAWEEEVQAKFTRVFCLVDKLWPLNTYIKAAQLILSNAKLKVFQELDIQILFVFSVAALKEVTDIWSMNIVQLGI